MQIFVKKDRNSNFDKLAKIIHNRTIGKDNRTAERSTPFFWYMEKNMGMNFKRQRLVQNGNWLLRGKSINRKCVRVGETYNDEFRRSLDYLGKSRQYEVAVLQRAPWLGSLQDNGALLRYIWVDATHIWGLCIPHHGWRLV